MREWGYSCPIWCRKVKTSDKYVFLIGLVHLRLHSTDFFFNFFRIFMHFSLTPSTPICYDLIVERLRVVLKT